MEFKAYEIGKQYAEFYGNEEVKTDFSDEGLTVIIKFKSPTPNEIEQMKVSFEMKYVVLDDIMLFLYKFGNLNWMDAPYSPHLSLNLTSFPAPQDGEGILTTIFLADANTGELKYMRSIGLSTDFSNKIIKEIQDLKNKTFCKTVYDEKLRYIYSKYTTKELLKLSSARFRI